MTTDLLIPTKLASDIPQTELDVLIKKAQQSIYDCKPRIDSPASFDTDNYQQMLDIYRAGGFDVHVCAALHIPRSTFLDWKVTSEEFKKFVEIGKVLSEVWWLNQGISNLINYEKVTFNSTLWYMIMRNKFNWGDRPADRRRKINYGGTLAQKMQILETLLQNGEITTTEHHNFIDSLYKEAQIFEIYKLQPRVEKLILDTALKNGEITQQEHAVRIAALEAKTDVFDDLKFKSHGTAALASKTKRAKDKAAGKTNKDKLAKEKTITMARILGKE